MLEKLNSVFLEEASDLLSSLEDNLLSLESDPENNELISAVFRVMHTIKGSAGMFGFDDISKFTHEIETAYDLVRSGKVKVTSGLISLTLKARDLINVMLPDGKKVREIAYATTEIPGFSPFNKSIRIDLRCTGEDNSSFIVEVQCYHQENFFRRCVLYASKTYDSVALKGDGNIYDIPPVYFIGLLGKGQGIPSPKVDRSDGIWSDRFISEYTFREKLSMDVPDDTIFFIFAELDRFSKKLDDCTSLLDKWLFALKHVGTLDSLPEGLRSKAFERLFLACEIARFEPERRITYEENMITERDYYNIINTAKNDGRAEGRIEIAKSLKQLGVPAETIMQATGMSEQELLEL